MSQSLDDFFKQVRAAAAPARFARRPSMPRALGRAR
jgi:hypothetical protein